MATVLLDFIFLLRFNSLPVTEHILIHSRRENPMHNAKPCPFCQSTRLSFDCSHLGTSMRVRCRSCDALGPWIFKAKNDEIEDLAQECIERWNFRKSQDGFTKVQDTYFGGKTDDEIRAYGREQGAGEPQVRTYRPELPAAHRGRSTLSRSENSRYK